jgi:putative sterol carrier protein
VTISVGDEDFVKITTGKLNSQQAFMKGKLKVRGSLSAFSNRSMTSYVCCQMGLRWRPDLL